MAHKSDKYADFVDHPRYGRRPHITGLNPSPTDLNVYLHWNATSHKEVAALFESVIGKPWPYGDPSFYSKHRETVDTAVNFELPQRFDGLSEQHAEYVGWPQPLSRER